ncbi:zinc finger protein-domain-containing protein [Penicillium longicatenatum]|uniref:zinc finger protein-domain-containing protein n=1 Tax=Penicillium longicatenatum TaxID=1561947 RepID=UPI002547ECC8|nr:zinc finger protein-domain-containing protein [Penicillium longicatenatum]KAJ5651149.1 zinc finger protein-domain-containing protein [Penicillium longicatenatum]
MDRLRHSKQSSSEDSPVSASSSFVADMNLTNHLSTLLDREHNDMVVRELNLLDATISPENILLKVLSPESFTGTASSFARFQQGQQLLTSIGYRTIGFGQCGLVFERPGRGYVLKVAKPSYEDSLWADFKAHYSISQAFQKYQNPNQPMQCRVPQLFSYITKENDTWWNENKPFFTTTLHETISLPAMALISQRILPLPKIAREALINKYCAEPSRALVAANPTNRDCLARVYLGRRRNTTAPPANFTLRNFNLYLDQMIELGLPISKMAGAIGEALALVHWAAHVDGYDIEFVLGSEGNTTYTPDVSSILNMSPEQIAALSPHTDIESMMSVNFQQRTTRLWMLDFNLCNMWSESVALSAPEVLVSHLVMSFFENDPYFPLPLMESELDQELWEVFAAQYLQMATKVLNGKDPRLATLPLKFLDGCVERERDSIENGLGHGHRIYKQ